MPAPLIAKFDRLASSIGEPPAHFADAVSSLPGLEAMHMLQSPDGTQRAGLWLWRGREGMNEGHAALEAKMRPLGRPDMIEERILDVVAVDGDVSGEGAPVVAVVHLGPFTSPAQREAYLGNLPRATAGIRTVPGYRGSITLSDPAGRDLLAVHFWEAVPDTAAIRQAIEAQPVPAGVDISLVGDPSQVEQFQRVRSILPKVAA